MKAVLEFNLDDPEDEIAYKRCVMAKDMAIVLFELQNIKKAIERMIESNLLKGEIDTLHETFEAIYQEMESQGVNIDQLIR